jgi:hypothetical protein
MIKGLKWGDKILLASFIAGEQKTTCQDCKKCGENTCGNDTVTLACFEGKLDGRKNKKDGKAEVFGYFVISGLNIIASDDFKEALASQLNVVETKELNINVERQCGHYLLSQSRIITDDLKTVIERIKNTIEFPQFKQDWLNTGIKVFVAGKFYPIDLTIQPVNFSRTLVTVDTKEDIINKETVETALGVIKNYNKRTYIKKHEKRGRPKKEIN